MDDLALLQRYASNRDDGAFTELVERYVGMVYGAALRRTGSRELAEEISQNVFALLARKASELKPGTVVSGWLHRAAVLQSAHAMRTEQRRSARMKEFSETLDAGNSGSNEPQAWADIIDVVDESMTQLEPEDRDLLFLRFCEERNYREIGEAIGKSESATQRHATRALEKLGGLLRKKGIAVPTTMLAAALTAELGKAAVAPAGLAATVSKFALSGAVAKAGTAATTSILTKIAIMIAQMKTGSLMLAACALIALFTGGGMLLGHLSGEKKSPGAVDDGASPATAAPAVSETGERPAAVPSAEPVLEKNEPTSVAALIAKAVVLAKSAHEPWAAKDTVRELMGDLEAEEMAEAFRLVSNGGERKEVQDFLLREIFRRWGSVDPATAMEQALETKSSAGLTRNVGAVAKSWAENDPEAAFDWYSKERSGGGSALGTGVLQEVLGDIAEGAIRHDVDSGFSVVETLDFDEQTAARAPIGDFAKDPEMRGAVAERILKIEDPQLKAKVVHDFGWAWAKDEPRKAADWFDQIEFEDPTEGFRAGNRIGEAFFEQHPREAVDWFFPKVPEEMKDHFVRGLVGQGWAQRDREAAEGWLRENGFDPSEIIK